MKKYIDQVPIPVWVILGILIPLVSFVYGQSINQGERNKQLQINTQDIETLKRDKLDKDAFLQFKDDFKELKIDIREMRSEIKKQKQ